MDTTTQQIKEKLDIVDIVRERIQLIPAGKNFKAVCPFHREKTPSFIVSPDRQTWHCFGSCSEGGDIFSFVMKYENIDFYEALKLLAEKAGIEIQKQNPALQQEYGVLYDIQHSAEEFFIQQLAQHKEVEEYLTTRGVQKETQELFGVGYAPHESDALMVYLVNKGYDTRDLDRAGLVFKTDQGTYVDRFRGRIMFPLRNGFGKTVGFSGRIMPAYENEKTGKYINSPETAIFNKSKLLYAWDIAKAHVRDEKSCIVVEGQMDCMMLHQDGVGNVVATSGTALTASHLQTIHKLTDHVTYFFDNDEAGKVATQRAIDMGHELDFTVSVYTVSEGKDAAEFIVKHPGRIHASLESGKISAQEYYLHHYLSEIDASQVKSNIRVLLEKISHIQSPIEKEQWIRAIAKEARISEHAVREEDRMRLQGQKITTRSITQEEQKPPQELLPTATRAEKIMLRIAQLTQYTHNAWITVEAYQPFFPSSWTSIMDALQNKPAPDLAQESARMIELRASLDTNEAYADSAYTLGEIKNLLEELKKEHLKIQRDELQNRIREAEKRGEGQEVLAQLLSKFDEITHLINNNI